jgi:hypothetical protein
MAIDLTLIECNATIPAVTVKDTDRLATHTDGFLDEALSAFRTE